MKKILFTLLLINLPHLLMCDKINITAGYLQRKMTEGLERTILKGYSQSQAQVDFDTQTIKANYIEIYGKDNRFIKGNGLISIFDSKENSVVYGDDFFYDRETEYLEIKGVVSMEDAKNNTVIKCKRLESFGKKEIIHFQASIRIFQKDSTARSEFAIYDKKTKNLELFGFPVVFKEGDEYRSTKITINTENENIVLQGEVRGQVTQENTATQQ